MRSSRLLSLLLLLQTRQRITTVELARLLEISRRTVLRDIEALSQAGVPVYAERGRHGGIVLLPGARLDVSRLEPGELEVLSVAGLDAALLERLGWAEAGQSIERKIAARRRGGEDDGRASLAELIHVDSTAWFAAPDGQPDIAGLARDLRAGRRLRLRYRRSAEARARWIHVDPYGLAVAAGRWYLVADVDSRPRLFALERLGTHEVLDEEARLRAGESLRTVWSALRERIERPGAVVVTAELEAGGVDLARRILGARLTDIEPAGPDTVTITVRYAEVEAVRQLLQFGDHLEVLSPPAARARIAELAADLARRHSGAGSRPGSETAPGSGAASESGPR